MNPNDLRSFIAGYGAAMQKQAGIADTQPGIGEDTLSSDAYNGGNIVAGRLRAGAKGVGQAATNLAGEYGNHSATNMGLGALAGGAVGGGMGYLLGGDSEKDKLRAALLGLLAGGGIGASLGPYAVPAVRGAYQDGEVSTQHGDQQATASQRKYNEGIGRQNQAAQGS